MVGVCDVAIAPMMRAMVVALLQNWSELRWGPRLPTTLIWRKVWHAGRKTKVRAAAAIS
jgi:hypothetical protein